MSHAGPCNIENGYNGNLGWRISSIFVILVGSGIGSFLPLLRRILSTKRLYWDSVFHFLRYVGYGVIIATAFIHLLAPANDALSHPCLTGVITTYPWVEGIALMTVFVFLSIHFWAKQTGVMSAGSNIPRGTRSTPSPVHPRRRSSVLQRFRDDTRIFSVAILEFGIIFHSVFIGLTLAVAGEEFGVLYGVIVVHQFFEGIALGTRIEATFGEDEMPVKCIMAGSYSISTPVAIAVGLGVRKTYGPESRTTLIVNGVFDSISAGILIYVGLVDLIAYEFLLSSEKPNRQVMAYVAMCAGAFIMALLGRWA